MDFVSKEAKGYIKEWGSTINGEEINNSRYCRIVRCCKKQGFPLFEWGKRPGGNRAEEKEGHRGVPYGKRFSNML